MKWVDDTMRPALASVFVWLALTSVAAAHDGDDPLSVWYRSLTTTEGQSCCSMRDCAIAEARLEGDHWEVWIVPYEGDPHWVSVPEEAVLRRENPDGRPIVCRTPNGFIRCFVP